MKNKIQSLKVAVLELEKAAETSDGNSFNAQLQNIKELCNQLKIATSPPADREEHKRPYHRINNIPFLIKPMSLENIFEGDHLERFAEERTEQLMMSRAINHHNEFWKQHETLSGNVYGSVPAELLTLESAEILENAGWDRVDVDILDFGGMRPDYHQLTSYCNKHFDRYILVKETSTETVLALVFNM